MTRFFEQFFFLPIRTFLFTMGKVAETLKGWQELGEDSLLELTTPESTAEPGKLVSTVQTQPTPDPWPLLPLSNEPWRGPSRPPSQGPELSPFREEWLSPQPPPAFSAEVPAEPSPIFEPFVSNEPQNRHPNPKEDRVMYLDQDLSGDQVKVVLYSIVNVVPGIADNERVVAGPCLVAFSDDMSPEDFTAWIIAERCPKYSPEPQHKDSPCPPAGGPYEYPCYPGPEVEKCWDKKYLRVAYVVMGRFNVADINWEQLQAVSLAKMVGELRGIIQHQNQTQPGNSVRMTVANTEENPVPVKSQSEESEDTNGKKS